MVGRISFTSSSTAGTLVAFSIGAAIMAWYLLSGRSRVKLSFKGFRFQRAMFYDILQVGAIACFSPLQIVLTVTIFTHLLANFGTEVHGYYLAELNVGMTAV